MRIIFLFLLNTLIVNTFAQGVALSGVVQDSLMKPLANVAVLVMKSDTLIEGAMTDVKGEYLIPKMKAGVYDIYIRSLTETKTLKEVSITTNKVCYLTTHFKREPEIQMDMVIITAYKIPRFRKGEGYGCPVTGKEQLQPLTKREKILERETKVVDKQSKKTSQHYCNSWATTPGVIQPEHHCLADRRLIAPARFMPQVYVPIR